MYCKLVSTSANPSLSLLTAGCGKRGGGRGQNYSSVSVAVSLPRRSIRENYYKSTVHPRGTIRNISTITGTSGPCVECHYPPGNSRTPSTWLRRSTATYLPLVCVTMWTCTGQRRFGLNIHQKRQPSRATGWLKPLTRPCGDSVFITPTGLAFLPPATAAHPKRQKAQASSQPVHGGTSLSSLQGMSQYTVHMLRLSVRTE